MYFNADRVNDKKSYYLNVLAGCYRIGSHPRHSSPQAHCQGLVLMAGLSATTLIWLSQAILGGLFLHSGTCHPIRLNEPCINSVIYFSFPNSMLFSVHLPASNLRSRTLMQTTGSSVRAEQVLFPEGNNCLWEIFSLPLRNENPSKNKASLFQLWSFLEGYYRKWHCGCFFFFLFTLLYLLYYFYTWKHIYR